MKKYNIRIEAHYSYDTTVEAETLEDARQIGRDMGGDGYCFTKGELDEVNVDAFLSK